MSGKHFGGRTLARSQALQLLFQAEASARTVEEVLDDGYVLYEGPLDDYARELAVGADSVRDDLDDIISMRSATWTLMRMPAVDRNLLRLALFEMLDEDEVDIAVTIDECVELAKAYSTDESPRFVNGLLGRVADDLEAGVDVIAVARADAERRSAEARRGMADEAFDGEADVADDVLFAEVVPDDASASVEVVSAGEGE